MSVKRSLKADFIILKKCQVKMLDTFKLSDIILKAYESIMAYMIFKFVAGIMERIVEQNLLYDFYGELLNDHQKKIYERCYLQ